jgi:hypothetical protein
VAGEPQEADRAAVLETVRLYFGGPGEPSDDLLGGWLYDYSQLMHDPDAEPADGVPPPGAMRHERTLERAELLELGPERAVVDVRAVLSWKAVHGTFKGSYESRGPAVLEKIDGAWRIVDFDVAGMARSTSIVVGTLAEQHHEGATARVIALDRSPVGTAFVVELVDTGAGPMTLSQSFALVEDQATWARMATRPKDPVPAWGSRRFYALASAVIPITETLIAVALDVRAGSHRLPFLLRVPPVVPEELVPQQPPPRRLPVLRSTSTRGLLVAAAVTAGVAWFYGWVALLVPIFVGLEHYRRVRKAGRLPPRLRPVRHLLDVAVIATGFVLLWETPAEYFAIPYLVAIASYLILFPFGARHEQMRIYCALTAGVLWLILLGGPGDRFSPCRFADGDPADVARRFASAVVTGDMAQAGRVTRNRLPLTRRDISLVYTPVPGSALSQVHPGDPAARYCSAFSDIGGRCYRYGPAKPTTLRHVLLVGIGCNGKTWRVAAWI